jgi:bifunctional DNA-binding transcriptional regulator/antitoxin component of YhaV-PrlF toxin-antitoxin module
MGMSGKVRANGETTIPQAVREQLGLSEGSWIEWQVNDGRATVVANTRRMIDLAGILGRPTKGAGLRVEEMDDVVGEAVSRHVLGEEEEE